MKKQGHIKEKGLAALLTFLLALALLLFLFFAGLSYDREQLALDSTPEIMDDEPVYIEPELMNLGEPDAVTNDMPAPAVEGERNFAPEENPVTETNSEIKSEVPKPAPITGQKPSEMKVAPPTSTDKEKKEASSAVAAGFSQSSGSREGDNSGNAGAGGSGTGIKGEAVGRTFISCPTPDVSLRHKTIVKVNVVIDAEGNVTEAHASGSAVASIRQKCEAAAKRAKWSAKKGAGSTRGSITFTIIPR